MEGKQLLVHEAIMEMALAICEAKYGQDDNFDVEAWRDDMDDLSYIVEGE